MLSLVHENAILQNRTQEFYQEVQSFFWVFFHLPSNVILTPIPLYEHQAKVFDLTLCQRPYFHLFHSHTSLLLAKCHIF